MRKELKIIILTSIVILAGIGIFFLFLHSYSVHSQGIGLTYYYETDSQKLLLEYLEAKIVSVNDEDLKDLPKIKGLLLLALEQELPLEKDGFELRDNYWNSYWVNKEMDGLRIQTAISEYDSKEYEQWASDHMLESTIVEYQNRYFTFYIWIE